MAKYVNEYSGSADILQDAQESWRKYLLNQEQQIDSHVHLFITDVLDEPVIPVKGFNMYMARGLDGTVAVSQSSCLVYAKFVRFCIFSWLSDYDSGLWVNTRVVNGDGKLKGAQEIRDGRIGSFLVSRIRDGMTLYQRTLSPRQRKRISANQQCILPKLVDSDMGDALLKDSISTVDTTFFPQRHIRRNESCPCGSGKKFKSCCGKPV